MRREGRVRGTPTNHSRCTGRCRLGRPRCRFCRAHPVDKAMSKTKGENKAQCFDINLNHLMHDWRLNGDLLHDDEDGGGEMESNYDMNKYVSVSVVDEIRGKNVSDHEATAEDGIHDDDLSAAVLHDKFVRSLAAQSEDDDSVSLPGSVDSWSEVDWCSSEGSWCELEMW